MNEQNQRDSIMSMARGAECWQTDTVRRILEQEPKVRTVCTACALKGLGK